MIIRIVGAILLIAASSCSAEESTTHACEPLALPDLPKAFMTEIMWNIDMGFRSGGPNQPSQGKSKLPPIHEKGVTKSLFEVVDDIKKRAAVDMMGEINMLDENNRTVNDIAIDSVIWDESMDGIDQFINTVIIGSGKGVELACFADKIAQEGGLMDWLFGFDPSNPDHNLPSVAHMLHFGLNYTSGCETNVRGMEVNTWHGHWSIAEWNAELEVTYYFSNPEKWESSAGPGNAVPVRAKIEGMANDPNTNMSVYVNQIIDYSGFIEIEVPDAMFQPPSDLWCTGRQMYDALPKLPNHFQFESEIIFTWAPPDTYPISVIAPRSEWYDYLMQVSRTDYKPLNMDNIGNPYAGGFSLVSNIKDFNTGLSYTINKDFGNCSIEYIINDSEGGNGDIHIDPDGHIHMTNPMDYWRMKKKFAYNGVYAERGAMVDSFINSDLMDPEYPEMGNITTVVYLLNSQYEETDDDDIERLIPARIERFATAKYNEKGTRMVMNVFHFSKHDPDFQDYDITPCFEEPHMMHLMVRMGWTPEMDIENTIRQFYREVRYSVVIWGEVTPIRVQNIEMDIDFANSAYYIIFTVVDYPPNMDEQLNEFPNAVRPIAEVKAKLAAAINKGWFKVKVYKNDGNGGTVSSQAEAGSLVELGDRNGNYVHKTGYTSGSMAALGIIMLIITVSGSLALLVFVLKW